MQRMIAIDDVMRFDSRKLKLQHRKTTSIPYIAYVIVHMTLAFHIKTHAVLPRPSVLTKCVSSSLSMAPAMKPHLEIVFFLAVSVLPLLSWSYAEPHHDSFIENQESRYVPTIQLYIVL